MWGQTWGEANKAPRGLLYPPAGSVCQTPPAKKKSRILIPVDPASAFASAACNVAIMIFLLCNFLRASALCPYCIREEHARARMRWDDLHMRPCSGCYGVLHIEVERNEIRSVVF